LQDEKLKRINELARKKASEGLSDDEVAEQKALREEYVGNVRISLEATLESISIVDESGNKKKLTRKNE
jgi:uncharacterized protein YnzC (UPF0291/DUF896 family)